MALQQPNRPESAGTAQAYARHGISFSPDWREAIDDVVNDVLHSATGAPQLSVVFISAAWSDSYKDILTEVRRRTGAECLIGCSSSGVIGGATCHESAPGITLAAMWLPGASLHPVRLDAAPSSWPWSGITPAETRGIIMFADPYRTDAQGILIGLRKQVPATPIVGAQASTSRRDRHVWVFLDDEIHDSGAVALAIEGPYQLLVSVSQGGTPIGQPWTVTNTEHNRVIGISNRPALAVMHEAIDEISTRGLGEGDLLVGFPMDEYQDSFGRDDFVARGILASDTSTQSFMVGCVPRLGQTIQFLERDVAAASKDLDNQLATLRDLDVQIVGGILCTCKGRGTHMFGRNDHDAAAVAEALPDVPVVGLYSLGEIGPVRGVPAFNAFACSLGLIVREG